jgi:mRNA-degrading endonuclease YafQ of YafQ-DinJ toxin-antitoxin module
MKVVHEKAFNKGLERLKKSGDMPRVGPHLAKVTDTLGTGKHPDPVYGHHELKGKGKVSSIAI